MRFFNLATAAVFSIVSAASVSDLNSPIRAEVSYDEAPEPWTVMGPPAAGTEFFNLQVTSYVSKPTAIMARKLTQ